MKPIWRGLRHVRRTWSSWEGNGEFLQASEPGSVLPGTLGGDSAVSGPGWPPPLPPQGIPVVSPSRHPRASQPESWKWTYYKSCQTQGNNKQKPPYFCMTSKKCHSLGLLKFCQLSCVIPVGSSADHFCIAYIRINSKWIKKLNVVPETIKLWEENISDELFDTSLVIYILKMIP